MAAWRSQPHIYSEVPISPGAFRTDGLRDGLSWGNYPNPHPPQIHTRIDSAVGGEDGRQRGRKEERKEGRKKRPRRGRWRQRTDGGRKWRRFISHNGLILRASRAGRGVKTWPNQPSENSPSETLFHRPTLLSCIPSHSSSHRHRQCCRRHKKVLIARSLSRAWGRWASVVGARVRSPDSGATAHSAFLPARFFFACGFHSSPRPSSLSLSPSVSVPALRMRVRLSGRTFSFSFVRSPFLLVFRLYLFLIARSSSFLSRLRPLRPRTHSLARSLDLPLLLPFLRPIRHHWQFGPSEAPSRLKTLKMPASARSSSSGIAK